MKNFEDTMKRLNFFKSGNIGSSINSMMIQQKTVSELVPGAVVDDIPNEKVAEICFALSGEIFELAQELGWKSWKENPEMTEEQIEKIKGELGDVMAFFNLLLVYINIRTGLDGHDFNKAYQKTCEKNVKRFFGVSGEDGYKNLQE